MRRLNTLAVLLTGALAVVLLAGRSIAQMHRGWETRSQPKHIRIDAARIAAIDDVKDLIEPVWWSVDIYSGPEAYEASAEPFTRAQRLVNAIQWYRAEVNNGGHGQFYGNSTGIVWRDALAGFELLGLSELADNLRESADLLGGEPTSTRSS